MGNRYGWVSHRSYASYPPLTAAGASPAGDAARLELADVGRLARRAARRAARAARAEDQPTLTHLLQQHLGEGLGELPVVEESWPAYEHVNVQAGLDAWLAGGGRQSELVGVIGFQHHEFGLGELLEPVFDDQPFGPRPGNVARANLASGPGGEVRACVRCGLYLVDDGQRRAAVLLRGAEQHGMHQSVTIQVVSTEPAHAAEAARDVRALALRDNVFRAQVLSFDHDVFGGEVTLLQFHERPGVTADQVVLPGPVLAAVRRQVVDLAVHKHRLLAAGQHLKRGVLLYGPPGAGKTHTVRHLISQLPDVTVLMLTGTSLHLIAEACSVARSLQPSMLVVEDVDLIAEDRGMHPGHHPLLFQLLNEMDGLAEDADVVFVLTTNRADLLEPALAARPGRVDQAVELELPDAAGRRALFELYRGRLDVDTSGLDEVIARTEGVTASFLKELLRRAAVVAADRSPTDEALRVSADDLSAALDELLDTRNAMTRVLLGSAPPRPRVGSVAPDEDEDGLVFEDELLERP